MSVAVPIPVPVSNAGVEFDAGVLEFAGKLRSFIRRRVSDNRDAEDIAQNVFLKVFKARSSLRDAKKLEAWLYQTARGAIIDHYRRRRPTQELPASLAADSDELDEVAERLRRSVRRFLYTLPEGYRKPLELAEFEGLTASDIAKKLGLSETATKSRLQRGRALLREKLIGCCQFEFDSFGKIIDLRQRAPCLCEDDSLGGCDSNSSPKNDSFISYSLASEGDEGPIRSLLIANGLPTEDLSTAHFLNFVVAKSSNRLVGSVGLELYGKSGLLRSLVVEAALQGRGVGQRLVKEAERLAQQLELDEVYLLTMTADQFFQKLGYVRVSRSDAPRLLRKAPEFISLCPDSAALMKAPGRRLS